MMIDTTPSLISTRPRLLGFRKLISTTWTLDVFSDHMFVMEYEDGKWQRG